MDQLMILYQFLCPWNKLYYWYLYSFTMDMTKRFYPLWSIGAGTHEHMPRPIPLPARIQAALYIEEAEGDLCTAYGCAKTQRTSSMFSLVPQGPG